MVVIVKKDNEVVEKLKSKISVLAPFKPFEAKLRSKSNFEKSTQYEVTTIIIHKGLKPIIFSKNVIINSDNRNNI